MRVVCCSAFAIESVSPLGVLYEKGVNEVLPTRSEAPPSAKSKTDILHDSFTP